MCRRAPAGRGGGRAGEALVGALPGLAQEAGRNRTQHCALLPAAAAAAAALLPRPRQYRGLRWLLLCLHHLPHLCVCHSLAITHQSFAHVALDQEGSCEIGEK